jgi:hypothetical protein
VVINDAWNAFYRWHQAWLLMMHGMHPTKDITAPNNINGYQYTVPVASSVVINDAWNASYKEHHRTKQH